MSVGIINYNKPKGAIMSIDTYANLPPFGEFITRVNEHHVHNLVHHPDRNNTLDEAFHEVLTDMIDEVLVTQQREAENAK